MSDEGFLSRWARRKARVQGDAPPVESPPLQGASGPVGPDRSAGSPHAARNPRLAPDSQQEREEEVAPTSLSPPAGGETEGEGSPVDATVRSESPPPPPMDDVAHLTRSSDFARFIAPGVDESVKRAAMKKLFSDPHFNVMDGLDVYIEDYNKTTPLTEADLRKMVQSKVLRLFEQDEPPSKEAMANPDGAAPAQVSQSDVAGPPEAHTDGPSESAVPPDENADLRLQPDDAAGRAGAEPGARRAGR